TSDKDKLTSPEHPDMPTLSNETESAGEESSPDRWKHKKSQSLAEFFGQEPASDPEPDPVESTPSHNGDSYSEQNQVEYTEASYASESVNTDGNWESPSSFPNDNVPESSSHDGYEWESSSSLS